MSSETTGAIPFTSMIVYDLYDLELRRPVEFRIEHEDDMWIAVNDDLNLYCYGLVCSSIIGNFI